MIYIITEQNNFIFSTREARFCGKKHINQSTLSLLSKKCNNLTFHFQNQNQEDNTIVSEKALCFCYYYTQYHFHERFQFIFFLCHPTSYCLNKGQWTALRRCKIISNLQNKHIQPLIGQTMHMCVYF